MSINEALQNLSHSRSWLWALLTDRVILASLFIVLLLAIVDPANLPVSLAFLWDAVVGIRGKFNLAKRWFMPYVLDIGTGDSDYTWHASGGIGYQFDKFQLLALYRYMHWEFDDSFSLLKDLTLKGPLVGAMFRF